LQIIYEINQRFLKQVRLKFPNQEERVRRMSIIEEGEEQLIRMAHLACIGSFSINGVAELQSDLLKDRVLHDFYEMWHEKFNNKTNGVTPRRFVGLANPALSDLITSKIGDGWMNDLERLSGLESYVDDKKFRKAWRDVKRNNKVRLAAYIQNNLGIEINPDSIFDVMVKRLHEYKRQLLKALHIITLYQRIKADPNTDVIPRTFIFGAKAAPGYHMAKLIIKLINSVAAVMNNDPVVRDRLKIVFIPNFNVTLGEIIYPAADISEQISMAGKEASGTGNMKFALNGAITVGTLDGANIEIRERVGEENFFLFGLTTEEVFEKLRNNYAPTDYYNRIAELRNVMDWIAGGYFSSGDAGLFRPIVDSLLYHDEYLLFADFESYLKAQADAEIAYVDQERWTRMSIFNTARCGFFSSDRAMLEYNRDIWKASLLVLPEDL
jgi:starch phosphorylase